MKLSTQELVAIAHRHAEAEAVDDFETTMATLDEDPVYELQPLGVAFHGRDAARTYYEYFFETAKPMISGYDLRNEWVNDDGLAQEYAIHFQLADGSLESHSVLSILTFGDQALSGERLYASDRLFELLFGPALDLAKPLA